METEKPLFVSCFCGLKSIRDFSFKFRAGITHVYTKGIKLNYYCLASLHFSCRKYMGVMENFQRGRSAGPTAWPVPKPHLLQ
jgi:hypothetical protein